MQTRAPAVAVPPEELNETSDEFLFERIGAVIQRIESDDSEPRLWARPKDPVAPFITLRLAYRVHERVQQLINGGLCQLTKLKLLCWVITDLTGRRPPADPADAETWGTRINRAIVEYTKAHKKLTQSRARDKADRLAQFEQKLCSGPWGAMTSVMPGLAGPSAAAALAQRDSPHSATGKRRLEAPDVPLTVPRFRDSERWYVSTDDEQEHALQMQRRAERSALDSERSEARCREAQARAVAEEKEFMHQRKLHLAAAAAAKSATLQSQEERQKREAAEHALEQADAANAAARCERDSAQRERDRALERADKATAQRDAHAAKLERKDSQLQTAAAVSQELRAQNATMSARLHRNGGQIAAAHAEAAAAVLRETKVAAAAAASKAKMEQHLERVVAKRIKAAQPELRQVVREEFREEISEAKRLKAAAHEKKRKAIEKANKSELLLERAQEAEQEVDDLRTQVDELHTEVEDSSRQLRKSCWRKGWGSAVAVTSVAAYSRTRGVSDCSSTSGYCGARRRLPSCSTLSTQRHCSHPA